MDCPNRGGPDRAGVRNRAGTSLQIDPAEGNSRDSFSPARDASQAAPTLDSRLTLPPARLRHLVARLHRLGPQPLLYFIREIAEGADVYEHLERYAEIDTGFVHAFRADRFQPLAFAVKAKGGET
jgi:hypothetical protein